MWVGRGPGILLALAAGVLVACSSSGRSPDPQPLHLTWQGSGLPAPAGGRAVVRAATWCAGRWVVAGATEDTTGRTRPAVWESPDGRHWEGLTLHPGADYYTEREILTTVACSHGRLAALGSMAGGAHGMPRRASWRERPDGSLVAVRAAFGLFAGSETLGIGGMVGGPDGFLVAGSRNNGAAAWRSSDGGRFRLYDGVPGLANTSRTRTLALAAAPVADGWLVAGELIDAEGRLRGVVWSGDRAGPWTRAELPGASTVSTGEGVVETPAGPDVAGLLDRGFGLWISRNDRWRLEERFGTVDVDATTPAYVSGMGSAGGYVAVTYSDGARFGLWVGEDVPMPTRVTVDGDRTATVAAHGFHLLLLTDDDTTGRAWLATVPRPVA